MMSLAYGKVSASAARLVLAKKTTKVYEINDINVSMLSALISVIP